MSAYSFRKYALAWAGVVLAVKGRDGIDSVGVEETASDLTVGAPPASSTFLVCSPCPLLMSHDRCVGPCVWQHAENPYYPVMRNLDNDTWGGL
ncbi:hypothetical protein Pcinc_005700 [Petrolisthes cinctipes]|uniref:Uncharacterized protein n=1 Tax=Petrolisthes cinctipes TaxID=88211 RepID=A0AAE1KZU6_PETCI|nr:hypothetical protein Pcinc_005700 [Petrolisthes cinctipes]